jgi:hypothetical protein
MSRIEVDLKTFLLSGQFGPLTLGLSRSQIVKSLGWPDGWTHGEHKLIASVWAYDWIEFYFDSQHRLELIRSDHMDAFEDNQRFNFDTWILNPGLSLEQAEAALLSENMPFQKTKHPRYDINYLHLQSGVEVSFEPDEDQPSPPYLVAFHYRNIGFSDSPV